MKNTFQLAINLAWAVGILLTGNGMAQAEPERTVGVVAINYTGGNLTSLSTSIGVGKNFAAGTASLDGTHTATSAVAGAGLLIVTNPNTTSVGYSTSEESATGLGTTAAVPLISKKGDVTSNSTTKVITIIP